MSDLLPRRIPWLLAAAVPALLLVALAPVPALAQAHDLAMYSLNATPNPLQQGCSANLTASFLINGHADSTLTSGNAAEIRFYHASGGSIPDPGGSAGWSYIGKLDVTWTAGDGPFVIGREWPTHFPSAPTSVSWSVPNSSGPFHLKAEVVYTAAGVTDDVAGNNVIAAANVGSVPGNCGSGSCCTTVGAGVMTCLHCIDKDILRIPRDRLICLIEPDRCRLPPIPICSIIDCNPCLRGLSCPPEPWDILVRWPEELMRVELMVGEEVVARSEVLPEPIKQDGQLFHQVLRFEPKKDVEYGVRALAGPKAELGAVYPLELRARPVEMRDRDVKSRY